MEKEEEKPNVYMYGFVQEYMANVFRKVDIKIHHLIR